MRYLISGLACVALSSAGASAQAPRVVDNPRPTWKPGEELVLSPAPTLVIGDQGGPNYEFLRIRGAARLDDGRIVVTDASSLTLRFFDGSGRYLKSAAGKGGGPGEFEQLDAFWRLPGDTLVAGSLMRGDLSYFTGEGKYLHRLARVPPPSAPGGKAAAGWPITLAPLDGSGSRINGMMPMRGPSSAGRGSVDSFPVAITDSRGVESRRLGTLPSMALAMDEGKPRTPWFGAVATYASDAKHFYFGFGSEYAISVYTRTGSFSHIIRRAWTPRKVTKADIDSYVVEWGKRWIKSSGAAAEAELANLRNDPYATTVPAFSQLIADRTGKLWVREAKLADAPGAGQLNTTPLVQSTWSVFSPLGVWLGDVTMPARFLPRDIGADYVLGTAIDADGVETVVSYRLSPSGKSAK
jgi:hypothetical protein